MSFVIHSAQLCGASVSVPLAFQTKMSVSSGHESASDHTEMLSQKTARKARVQRKASGEQQRNQPAGLPYAVLHGIECSRKKRWSVRHLPEMGATQMRHGLQHATQAFGLTSNSLGVGVVILCGVGRGARGTTLAQITTRAVTNRYDRSNYSKGGNAGCAVAFAFGIMPKTWRTTSLSRTCHVYPLCTY